MTQNMWGVRGAWDLRRKVIQRGVADLHPDVVSLQEAIKTADVDTAADVLGKGFNVVFQSHPEPNGQTAAIASRWPITAVHELDQHVTERIDSAAVTLVAEVDAPAPIRCWSSTSYLAGSSPTSTSELQAKAAGLFVEELVGERRIHVIVAGDLTDPPDSASVRMDRRAVTVRRERLLPRCLGIRASSGRRANVHTRQPHPRRPRLAVSQARLHLRSLRDALGSDAGDQVLRAHFRRARGRGVGQRTLRRDGRPRSAGAARAPATQCGRGAQGPSMASLSGLGDLRIALPDQPSIDVLTNRCARVAVGVDSAVIWMADPMDQGGHSSV
jgi:endonuclease/exonuclease/phosphatase family metal-dependent hydrolase